jgi:hypothetical protein
MHPPSDVPQPADAEATTVLQLHRGGDQAEFGAAGQ